MTEVFKPRENMVYDAAWSRWYCRDESGRLVCDGGPSVIRDYGNHWEFWIDEIGFHRLDGPANSNGNWFILGKNINSKIHQFAEENNIDLENLTDEDKVLIALKFG